MSLINELKAKSNNANNRKQEIIEEIKEYFDKYLDSDMLEKYLRKYIKKEEIEKRQVCMRVEFWEYHSGCHDTYFYCDGILWENADKHGVNSWDYKGVRLNDIHNEICEHISTKLLNRMKDLGFDYLKQEKQKSRFGYFNTYYYFGW